MNKICEICKKEFRSYNSISKHINRTHKMTVENYKLQILKIDLPLCGCGCGMRVEHIENKFINHHGGRLNKGIKFSNTHKLNLSVSLRSQKVKEKRIITCQKNLGYNNPSQSSIIKQKKISTCRKNNGTNFPMQSKEVQKIRKQHSINNIGVDHWMKIKENKDQVKNMTILHYGGIGFSVNKLMKKSQDTIFKKYGVKFSSQSKIIHENQVKGMFRRKKYILPSGKEIFLQGEEPSFLDYVFSNNLLKEDEIIYKPERIKYFKEDKTEHYYFADFFIPKFNLIVEIKSWYILSLDPKTTNLKMLATKSLGYNYLMILDKKYDEFKTLITECRFQSYQS